MFSLQFTTRDKKTIKNQRSIFIRKTLDIIPYLIVKIDFPTGILSLDLFLQLNLHYNLVIHYFL